MRCRALMNLGEVVFHATQKGLRWKKQVVCSYRLLTWCWTLGGFVVGDPG